MSYDMEQVWVCKGGTCGMPSCLRCAPASEREAKRGAALRAEVERLMRRLTATADEVAGDALDRALRAEAESARLRARLAEVEGAALRLCDEIAPTLSHVHDDAMVALRAVLSRTEGRTPPTKEPETGCGGPQEACIPCRKPRDHEAYRCTECGVTWCDECSCPAPTHDGGAR